MAFKIGDKVKAKKGMDIGTGGRVCKIVKIKSSPFLIYNVKCPKKKGLFEFHRGELQKIK